MNFDENLVQEKIIEISKQNENSALRVFYDHSNVLVYELFPMRSQNINADFVYTKNYIQHPLHKKQMVHPISSNIYYDDFGILEGDWFSVFIEDEMGMIYTRPLSRVSNILAGTMRAAVLYTLHSAGIPYEQQAIQPSMRQNYYATTSLRVLQPINGITSSSLIKRLQREVQYNIEHHEQGNYQIWNREILNIEP